MDTTFDVEHGPDCCIHGFVGCTPAAPCDCCEMAPPPGMVVRHYPCPKCLIVSVDFGPNGEALCAACQGPLTAYLAPAPKEHAADCDCYMCEPEEDPEETLYRQREVAADLAEDDEVRAWEERHATFYPYPRRAPAPAGPGPVSDDELPF